MTKIKFDCFIESDNEDNIMTIMLRVVDTHWNTEIDYRV